MSGLLSGYAVLLVVIFLTVLLDKFCEVKSFIIWLYRGDVEVKPIVTYIGESGIPEPVGDFRVKTAYKLRKGVRGKK